MLLKYLKTKDGIIRQLQWYLFVLRVYIPVKTNYERLFRSRRNHDAQRQSLVVSNNKQEPATTGWQFPEFPRILRLYNIISTILLVWVFLKYFIRGPFEQLGRLYYWSMFGGKDSDKMPGQCFVFGRFVLHYEMSNESIGCVLASFHVFWRLVQVTLNRPYLLDAVLFIMQPKDQIGRFIEKLNSANVQHHYDNNNNKKHLPIPIKLQEYLDERNLTEYERFLTHIMCYKVIYADKYRSAGEYPRVVYKLRSNRTLEAREKLIEGLTKMTIIMVSIFGSLALVITTYVFVVIIFSQYRYQNAYPGCDLELSRLYMEGNLPRWSSLQFSSEHFLAAFLADGLENVIVWVESGLVLIAGLIFATFLNSDLLDHWPVLDAKIQRLMRCTRQIYGINHDDSYFNGNIHNITSTLTIKYLSMVSRTEEEIYELQAELSDFFNQIRRVDLWLSDILTAAIFIWLGGFGVISHLAADVYSTYGNSEFAILCMGACFGALFGFSVVSFILLVLQRRCHTSYLSICSLMAYDKSRNKSQLMHIIDFYSMKNRTCYTLFQQFPYSTTTFLSITGWSLTGFLLLDSIFRRQ